ncbi:DsrE family protein [Sideroxydans sp. CL21]|jgi:intracellular sulfur oxidation DsrE/DsrF family protein|uniref:DsrE family protein n=1 Tax=Sideroxydans sp. CL21 TaxID=2600596 RepID=UPI0024BD590B|nr:DsrE family protein [Sideroxydans sp. CL21]
MHVQKKLILAVIASSLAVLSVPTVFAGDAASAVSAVPAPAATTVAETKASEYVKPNVKHGSYGQLNIVVALTSDDKGIQGMKLRNIANGLKAVESWKGKMNVTVVLYAKGITLLKNPDEQTQKKLDELKHQGVQIKVCDNTLREQGIDFHNLYHVTDADIVPSGFAEVAYLQAKKHFVIDPVN